MVLCKFCGIEREKNIFQHERMCPKNPGRVMPSFKGKSEPKTIIKTITDIIKTDDDKTTGKPPQEAGITIPASPVVSEKPEQEQQSQTEQKSKSWMLEICIAIVAILLAAFWIFHYFLMPPNQGENNE